MKIGFDAKRAFCNKRGLGNYSRDLIEGIDRNLDGELFCFGPRLNPSVFKKEIFSSKVSYYFPRGINCFIPSLWRSFSICKEIEALELDLYHGLSHELPFGIERLKLKKVVTIHDLTFLKHPEFFRYIDRKVYLMKYRYACKVADKVVAIAEQTKNDLIEILNVDPAKIEVIHQSIHPRFFANTVPRQEDEYVLYVGALDKHKNVSRLIEAMGHIDQKIKLIIISNGGNDLNTVESLLNDRVSLKKNVSNDELLPYLQNARAVVFPTFYEGFGLPILEAYASKTPVAMSDIPLFRNIAGDLGIYFDPMKPVDIADKIQMAIVRKEEVSYLEKLRLLANNYDQDKCALEMISLYKKVLS